MPSPTVHELHKIPEIAGVVKTHQRFADFAPMRRQ